MPKYIIEGGKPLSGSIGHRNKKEALPVLMACLLTESLLTSTEFQELKMYLQFVRF